MMSMTVFAQPLPTAGKPPSDKSDKPERKASIAPREEAPVPALPAELANLPAMSPLDPAGDTTSFGSPAPISTPLPTSPEEGGLPLSPEAAPPSTASDAKKPLLQDRRVQIVAGLVGLGSLVAWIVTRGNGEEAAGAVEKIKEPVAGAVEGIKEPVANVVKETKKSTKNVGQKLSEGIGGFFSSIKNRLGNFWHFITLDKFRKG